jgi:hypothetical protein
MRPQSELVVALELNIAHQVFTLPAGTPSSAALRVLLLPREDRKAHEETEVKLLYHLRADRCNSTMKKLLLSNPVWRFTVLPGDEMHTLRDEMICNCC